MLIISAILGIRFMFLCYEVIPCYVMKGYVIRLDSLDGFC